MGDLGFYIFGALSLVGALLMVTARSPLHGVLWLVVSFLGFAGLFGGLGAHFLAAIQILVYAGAILVLFLFVLMLLNIGHIPAGASRPFQTLLGSIAVVLFAALLLGTLRGSGAQIAPPSGADAATIADPASLSRELFSGYLLHFEAVSVLLLAALVGAFVLARREKRS